VQRSAGTGPAATKQRISRGHAVMRHGARSAVAAGDAEAGEITSSAYSPALGKVVALGYLRALHAPAGTAVKVGDRAGVVVE
jgi:glycine cleavage system aminomethyltransferase T